MRTSGEEMSRQRYDYILMATSCTLFIGHLGQYRGLISRVESAKVLIDSLHRYVRTFRTSVCRHLCRAGVVELEATVHR